MIPRQYLSLPEVERGRLGVRPQRSHIARSCAVQAARYAAFLAVAALLAVGLWIALVVWMIALGAS